MDDLSHELRNQEELNEYLQDKKEKELKLKKIKYTHSNGQKIKFKTLVKK